MVALIFGVLASSVVTASAAKAWRPLTNADLLWLRWKASTVSVRLATPWPEAYAPDAVQQVIERSLAAWATPDCGQPVFLFAGAGPEPTFDEDDGVTTIVPIADKATWDARFGATELARTLVISRASTGEILDADIAVNAGGFDYSTGIECAEAVYDLEATITHELGHVLGLDHSDVEAATMYFDVQPGTCAIRDLDDDDIAGICTVYPKPAPVEPGPEPVPEAMNEVAEASVEASDVAESVVDVAGGDTAAADPKPRDEPCLGCGGTGVGAPWLIVLLPFAFRRRGRERGPQASA